MLLTNLPSEIIYYIYGILPLKHKILLRNITSLFKKELEDPFINTYEIIKKYNKMTNIDICSYEPKQITVLDIYFTYNKKNKEIKKNIVSFTHQLRKLPFLKNKDFFSKK